MLVSKKETYGKFNSFKYFIGYNDNNVNSHYICFFRKRLATLINLIKKITMSLMIKVIQLLKNNNKIWKKN